MNDSVLGALLEDAEELQQGLRGAKYAGALTEAETHRAFSGIAAVVQIVKIALAGKTVERPLWEGPLSEFMRWPNRSIACPKCDNHKHGKVSYCPESNTGPERMEHVCICGYKLYTKPSDRSTDEFGRYTEDEDDAT